MAAVDALLLQVGAHVPLYQTAAGTVLVPLHPLLDLLGLDLLLEATALTLLRPQACMVAEGATALMVPLGAAFALLPFSQHFPEALIHVLQIMAVQTTAETRGADERQGPLP
jgi:predicted branched-subunit amino acid permease